MQGIKESELILNHQQRVYHLDVSGEHIADTVLLVGDPQRVQQISAHFTHIEHKREHREFITHTGICRGKRLSVVSTGIGPDNIDIVLNELDAAVNIDPLSREPRSHRRQLTLYRLGTCGALQPDIPINSLVATAQVIGIDNLMHFYKDLPQVEDKALSKAFAKHCAWPEQFSAPYAISGDAELLQMFAGIAIPGITVTAPGFYAPQGRQLRLTATMPQLNEALSSFVYGDKRILNFEMETSAIYGLGHLLQHRCLTLCVVIANRVRKEFSKDYTGSVHHLIEQTLNTITNGA